MGFVFEAEEQLAHLFPNRDSLSNIDAVLAYLAKHKEASNAQIQHEVSRYKHPVELEGDITMLTNSFVDIRTQSKLAQESILLVTSSIQNLDTIKKNLVLSMKVLKRLQMLINAYNSLNHVVHSRDYKEIATYLGAVRGLMEFFKSYKSIDEIATLNQQIHQTQNKLVDDVFIDFEDSFTNNFTNDKLMYGCEILELIDSKYKDKLLTWFYNLQLKEIQTIFSSADEAGNLENLSRRYIFFNNILHNIQAKHLQVFPALWGVDLELSKLFCKMTNQDLSSQLSSSQVPSAVLLEALTKTLAFEKSLNETFNTSEFNRIILGLFEPYLATWVSEQDSVLSSKFMEFYSSPKIPTELIQPDNVADILVVLKVNNVPNFAQSSVEMFKTFQKLLVQTIKLSSGEILIDLSKLFAKYLYEYQSKILSPILTQSQNNPKGLEPIKYLTMLLNTADYINKNITDLQDKFEKLIDEPFKGRISFDKERELYFDFIGKSIKALVQKVTSDLQFLWRQFENNSWNSMETVSDTSNYMNDFISSLKDNNRAILPLIIREGYVRSFCDRLVELLVITFLNKLTLVKPLSIINVEQILLDVSVLMKYLRLLPLCSDPNFDETKMGDDDEAKIPKAYVRHLTSQFSRLETLLKLLLTPVLPVDNLVENYLSMIGDKSTINFLKFLNLKNIGEHDRGKYVEQFKLQLASLNNLENSSPILSVIQDNKFDESHHDNNSHPASQLPPQQVDYRELMSIKSQEPNIPDFLKNNSAKIQGIKLNNPLRDFSINGETHVNKLNENFKNIGKFFRKDHHED